MSMLWRRLLERLLRRGESSFPRPIDWIRTRKGCCCCGADSDGRENSSYKLDVLKIYADIPKSLVTAKLDNGLISGCGVAVPNLTQKDIDEASVITSQMGVEPFHAAMEQYPDFDILLAGRTYDPEPYFAWATACVKKVMPGYAEKSEEREKMEGSILHFGKLMECGGKLVVIGVSVDERSLLISILFTTRTMCDSEECRRGGQAVS